jgi:branched-chain amino acid aminotransferase
MVSDSILDGVTRDSVLQLARDWGYTVEERRVSVSEVVDLMKAGKLDAAFGTGTAATIAHIGTIHHNGTDYVLPPYETRQFANRASQELELIKRGMAPDPHNWTYRVV